MSLGIEVISLFYAFPGYTEWNIMKEHFAEQMPMAGKSLADLLTFNRRWFAYNLVYIGYT